MSRRDDGVSLRQMLAHAQEAVVLTSGRTDEQVIEDRVLCLALRALLEIVGEAAARVSEQTRLNYPDVPWRRAITTRNRISHGYDSVDMGVVLETIRNDLPPLITQLEQILASDFPAPPPQT